MSALPLAVGAKMILTVQLCPTVSMLNVAPQVLVSEKSPATLIVVILRVAVPLLVMVTVWGALTVPTFWFANVKLVGATVTEVAAVTPIPVTVMF